MNLLEETKNIMNRQDKSPSDVAFINIPITEDYDNLPELVAYSMTWEAYCAWAEKYFEDYNNGYGGAIVPKITIVFRDNSWFERSEYDGSEWFEYKQTPTQF